MKKILVSDFDGTMTKFDFYDLVCKAFPDILKLGYWQQYEEGKITHFDALRRIFAEIRTDEATLKKIVLSMEIEPKLKDSIETLHAAGWEITVASAGCAWYIEQLLALRNVTLPVHANKGTFSPQGGLAMSMPEDELFVSNELGVNKVAVVREALKQTDCVAFAGDGRPDLVPALMVNPKRRFARSWLAKRLHEIGEVYVPFESWSQISELLAKADV
jgi:2-hydroxy-3-keto-5-methylthiopentenyl-1-phosphate phosphatase